MVYRFIKRAFDFSSALLLLIVISPLFLILMICACFSIGRPIFFRQERSGLHGKPFYLIKFRTMTDARDSEGNLLPDCQRQTKFGRFLRNTSLDELPELLNIIKGDMAVIGPRPLYTRYNQYYSATVARTSSAEATTAPVAASSTVVITLFVKSSVVFVSAVFSAVA